MNTIRKEFRFSGSGGQGLILAGIILAKAAINEGYRVTQTQSYGPESRGGFSRADVIVSNNQIYFPEAQYFDYLIALTQESADKYIYDLKETGLLLIDTGLVKNLGMTVNNLIEVDLTEITLDKLGSVLPVNVVSLSCVARLSGIVTDKSLEMAIRDSLRPALIDINIKAMKLGFEIAEHAKK
jgi:2-oxoglutarate ferredoxin oxidoreductase subunit gamma